eukprot:2586994-Rhodomonas_salina.2
MEEPAAGRPVQRGHARVTCRTRLEFEHSAQPQRPPPFADDARPIGAVEAGARIRVRDDVRRRSARTLIEGRSTLPSCDCPRWAFLTVGRRRAVGVGVEGVVRAQGAELRALGVLVCPRLACLTRVALSLCTLHAQRARLTALQLHRLRHLLETCRTRQQPIGLGISLCPHGLIRPSLHQHLQVPDRPVHFRNNHVISPTRQS